MSDLNATTSGDGRKMKVCSDCKYFFDGWCRRFPPRPTRHDDIKESWPRVRPLDWRGEYKPAGDEPEPKMPRVK
jgi:hypothetical protein